MALGYVFLLLSLIFGAAMGILFKLSDVKSCHPLSINVTTFLWASVLLWGYTILVKAIGQGVGLFPPFTMGAVLAASICGALASVGLVTFLKALQYGRIATSWAILMMASLLPAALSYVFLGEYRASVRWPQPAGLALVLASIGPFWRDKVIENRKKAETTRKARLGAGDLAAGVAVASGREPEASPVHDQTGTVPIFVAGGHKNGTVPLAPQRQVSSMWYLWIILAFITNGLAQFGLRVLKQMGLGETHTFLYLAFWYLAGLIVGCLVYRLSPWRRPINRSETVLGLLMGVSSAACWYFMSAAFVHDVPAYLALPVSSCGSSALVAVAGIAFWGERLSAYGYAGILVSMTGLALLVSA